ncbi:DEAD/DEAH box helicase [Salinibius halmophilus]|uniref:DEAD/DEAH box helicase n=1 Tax=Salinibius halmophilus TaxID=1853216 RepID=UPI000E66B6D0|nr:DEAD/DEAH box helicase [Salinibius halmophilus]
MTTDAQPTIKFADLGLPESLLKAIQELGYETPSPIQAQAIPHLLAGDDVVGQAQTGTGKTAAFALPTLSRIDANKRKVQALVLTPTRELAQQVAEACERYARGVKGMSVLAVYGGAAYRPQLRALERGTQIVVGTPGRIMDYLRKGHLKLDSLQTLVLDEADEMLKMGFQEDVEWILQHTPSERQTALFSATMPPEIRAIINNYQRDPVTVQITGKKVTVDSVKQSYWMVQGRHKDEALDHVMDRVEFDAAICFVRTRDRCESMASHLRGHGIAVASLHGDMAQRERERTIESLKSGDIDVIVATDVAARGLDVPRITLVVNVDIPHDSEAYVHRIGRTGRAGRTGQAIMLCTPRERRLLRSIEHTVGQKIEAFKLPSVDDVVERRTSELVEQLAEVQADGDLSESLSLVETFSEQLEIPIEEVAALLLKKLTDQNPLRPQERPDITASDRPDRGDRGDRPRRERGERGGKGKGRREPDVALVTYRVEVGAQDGIKPGNLVGAIANEAGLSSNNIGNIRIRNGFTLVDLPDEMPKQIESHLAKVRVCGKQLKISRDKGPRKG